MEAARAGGEAACDLIADGVRQLSELRTPRSTRNDPVAAAMAIVFAGLAALIMALAAAPGGPTPTTWWVLALFLMLLATAGASAVAALSALPWAAAAA
jgi:fatty acid desaturase